MGRIGKPHGLHGESTVLPTTDHPDRFAVGARFVVGGGRELVVASTAQFREHGLLVRFEGVDSRADAEALRGTILTIDPTERRDLADGEFWEDDLIGLTAVTPDGDVLGAVSRLEYGPGQDRLVVTTADGTEVLVPFVAAIVGDPSGDGTISIDAPEGLF